MVLCSISILINKQERMPNHSESKTFWFFLLIMVLMMLSYFLYNSNHCYLIHLKRGEPSLHGWPNKQILGNTSATFQHFSFDQQSEKILQAFQKFEILNFFCWLEYYWYQVIFWAPTQPGMMIDDTVAHVIVQRNF